MADTEHKEKGEGEVKKKGKLPLFAIIGVVLLLNGAVLGKVMLGGKGHTKPEKKVEEVGKKMPLEEFLINLVGGEHYLKTTIALGLKKDVAEKQMEEEIPPVRDAIVSVLCAKKLDELTSEAGKEKLKKELLEKINKELGGEKILKIYFTAFATQ